jgi:hypothetical protein
VAVSGLLRATNRSSLCTFERHRDVAAFGRATAAIYYIKEGGKDEQIEGVTV